MDTDQVLRVVQLNIGSLLEPDWETRRHEIVDWLGYLSPDVVCLEEVHVRAKSVDTGQWIADRLAELGDGPWHCRFGGAPVVVPTFASRATAGQRLRVQFGSAVLSRWPIEMFTHRLLSVGDNPSEFAKTFPFEVVHARTAGLDVFATHLLGAPADGPRRCGQVREIEEFVRSVRGERDRITFGRPNKSMPAILCGDFNAEPDSDEIRYLCGLTDLGGETTFWQDAWRVAGDGPGLTQDWTVAPIAASLNVHRKRIDYVFVGESFQRIGGAGRVLRASLAFNEPRTGIMASDHVGVVVDIRWPDKPARP